MTVFCQSCGVYRIGANSLDFTTCPLEASYHMEVVANIVNDSNKASFVNGALIQER
jgi:hypothetical protein